MTRATDWDAPSYHCVAAPHAVWGANVLDRLVLRGDEVVLDAGCGSGRVTAQLLERLPGGRVVAADVSPAMLDQARLTLEHFGARVTFVQTDLLEVDRVLPEPVDAIFSTATFHWIEDHARLFSALHHVLKPRGHLVAQFGGGANLAGFMAATDIVAARPAYTDIFKGKALWRFFYSPQQTEARLTAAGFPHAQAWLEPSPQTFKDHQALAEFCRTVVLSSHLAVLPDTQRPAFLDAVVDEITRRLGGYILDYVRLNVDATA